MASKVTLINLSKVDSTITNDLNTNFTRLADAIDDALDRTGASPNQLEDDVDANDFQVKNLGKPTLDNHALRLADITDDAKTAKATAVSLEDTGGNFSSNNVEGALEEIDNVKIVDSASDLQSGSFESGIERLWLSGYYGVGTAGGGPLYRDSADTTTADNGEDVFVDSDGVRWKRPLAYGLNEARNYTDLRANDAGDIPDNLVIYLHGRSSIGDGGEGHFRWDSSDLSTEVGNDEVTTGEGDGGIYVAPGSDKTGASGAWVRQGIKNGYWINWYGLDDTGFDAALSVAKNASDNPTLRFVGVLSFGTQKNIDSLRGFTLAGETHSSAAQGGPSDPESSRSILNWTGGAEAAITCDANWANFADFDFKNTGNATILLNLSASWVHIDNVAPMRLDGTPPSDSSFRLADPAYVYLTRINTDMSPVLRIGGTITTIFVDDFVFQGKFGASPIVKGDADCNIEVLRFSRGTWIAKDPAKEFIDFTGIQRCKTLEITSMELEGDESTPATDQKIAKLENTDLANFHDFWLNQVTDQDSSEAFIELTNSLLHIHDFVRGPTSAPMVETLDSSSSVRMGTHDTTEGSGGAIDAATNTTGFVKLNADGDEYVVQGHRGTPDGWTTFIAEVTDGNNKTISIRGPTASTLGGVMVPGQHFSVMVQNKSGGAMGGVVWDTGDFELASSFTEPANGNNRSISFVYDGSKAIEISRVGGDVSN